MENEKLLKKHIGEIGLPKRVSEQLEREGVVYVKDLYSLGFLRLWGIKFYAKPYFEEMLAKLNDLGFDTQALLDGKGKFTKEEVTFLRMPLGKLGLPDDIVRTLRGRGVKTLADISHLWNYRDSKDFEDRVIKSLQNIGFEANFIQEYRNGEVTFNHDKMPMALISDYMNGKESGNLEGRVNPKTLKIEDMRFTVRTYNCLIKAGISTLEDLLCFPAERLYKVRNLGALSVNEVIDKIEAEGYTVGEFADEKIRASRKLADDLLRDGLKVLQAMENTRFEKGSTSMLEIGEAVENYLNTLAEEKSKTAESNEDFDNIEKELSTLRAAYKKIVDTKREEIRALAERKAGFVAKMEAKNGEVRKYHHNPNNNHEHTHNHNPFANNEREL